MKSLQRIRAIAGNTFTEAIRQKVLQVLILFGIVLVIGSNLFTQFAFEEQFKFLKDIGYAAISWTGLLVALLGAAQLIPAEIERRTITVVMSKPVRPFEFVVGKYLGLAALLTFIVLLMSFLFGLVLLWKEQSLIHSATEPGKEFIAQVHASARDPRLIQAVLLIAAKLLVLAAAAVFLSTLATSTTFIVAMTIGVYFIGHLQSVAREYWLLQGMTWWQETFLSAVAVLIPDLGAFNLIDEIIAGQPVLWSQTGHVLGYSAVYVVVLLLASSLIFEKREL